MSNLCPTWPKTATPYISHDLPYSKNFLKHYSIMGLNKWAKVVSVNIPKIPFLSKKTIRPNLLPNYLTTYLMIAHRGFLKHFSMICKVILISFPHKYKCWRKLQNYVNLYNSGRQQNLKRVIWDIFSSKIQTYSE